MSTTVIVTLSVKGYHFWPDAPNLLRNPHMHNFVFRMFCRVTHDNRQIEFFEQQERMLGWIDQKFVLCTPVGYAFNSNSCEMLAAQMLEDFPEAWAVSVFEDDENGAQVER